MSNSQGIDDLYPLWLKQGCATLQADVNRLQRGYDSLEHKDSIYGRSMKAILDLRIQLLAVWDAAPRELALAAPAQADPLTAEQIESLRQWFIREEACWFTRDSIRAALADAGIGGAPSVQDAAWLEIATAPRSKFILVHLAGEVFEAARVFDETSQDHLWWRPGSGWMPTKPEGWQPLPPPPGTPQGDPHGPSPKD